MCLKACPSGYAPAGNICVYAGNFPIFDVILDTITPTIKTFTGQTLLNGATLSYYPSFELSDPRPVQHRGAYFSGSSYIQLPDAPNTSGPMLIYSDSVSLSVWIRPQYIGGLQVIYRKTTICDIALSLRIALTDSNTVRINVCDFSNNIVAPFFIIANQAVVFDEWNLVSFSLEYQTTIGKTVGKVYYDGVQVYGITVPFRMMDPYLTGDQLIGANSGNRNAFVGFIWRLTIYPYVRTFSADLASRGCPAELRYCLSTAALSQTYIGENCAYSCVDGCVRTSDCSPCADVLCDVCTDFETLTCSQCIPNAAVVGTCKCVPGYYYNSSTRSCDLCDVTCLTCVDPSACDSCKPGALLNTNKCECSGGYYGTADKCIACSQGCQLCKDEACDRCLPGYFNVEGVCSLSCPSLFYEDLNNWVCLPIPNPYSGVSVSGAVDEFNCVTLTLSQPVQPKLTLEALSLLLTDTNGNIYPFTVHMSELTLNQTFNISLTIREGYLPANNEFRIVILSPERYRDQFGNLIINPSLSLTLYPLNLNKTSETKEGTAIAAAIGTVVGVIVSILTGNPTSFFTFINTAQLLTYLPLSTIPLPDKLRRELIGVSLESFLSNPAEDYLSKATKVDQSTPDFALNYGFSTTSFLSNVWTVLVTFLLNLCVFLVLCMLSKVQRVSISVKKMLEGYQWRNVGMHWILCYLDLSIAAYLQILRVTAIQLSFTSAKAGISSLLGCTVALINSIFPFTLLYLTIRKRAAITSHSFESLPSWSFLYTEFKTSKRWLSSAYYCLFLLRRLLYALTLLYLDQFPFAQSLICYFHSMLVITIQTITYLAVYRPFESKLNAFTVTVAEIAIGLVFTLVIAFNFSLPAYISHIISLTASVCIYIAVCVPVAAGLLTLFLKLRSILAHYIKVRDKAGPVSINPGTHLGSSVVEWNKASGPADRPMVVYRDMV